MLIYKCYCYSSIVERTEVGAAKLRIVHKALDQVQGPQMNRAKSPVIVTDEVRDVIDEGGSVVIECLSSVTKKGTSTVGEWSFEIVSKDRKTRQPLVFKLTRQTEIVRSAVGVIAKLISWGLPTIAFPSEKGLIIEIYSDGRCMPVGGADT